MSIRGSSIKNLTISNYPYLQTKWKCVFLSESKIFMSIRVSSIKSLTISKRPILQTAEKDVA